MRFRNILLLFIVFVLLGTYIYLFELKRDLEESGEKLLNFRDEEVETIVLSYRDRRIQLNKHPSGKWVLTQPLHVPADESTINGILSALNSSEIKRIIEEKPTREDLSTFDLDKPWLKLLITLKKGKALPAILVGARTPIGYSAYVKRANEPAVLLTSASLRSILEKRLYDFRDKRILRIDQEKTARVKIQSGKESLILAREEGGNWKMEAPQKGRAKGEVVSDYLMALAQLWAKRFADDNPKHLKEYGLDPPSLKISLEGKAAEKLGTLLVGENDSGEFFAKRVGNSTVYSIDEFSYTQVNKTPADFLDQEKSDRPPSTGTKE